MCPTLDNKQDSKCMNRMSLNKNQAVTCMYGPHPNKIPNMMRTLGIQKCKAHHFCPTKFKNLQQLIEKKIMDDIYFVDT